jgi:hypothetical protein
MRPGFQVLTEPDPRVLTALLRLYPLINKFDQLDERPLALWGRGLSRDYREEVPTIALGMQKCSFRTDRHLRHVNACE